MKTAMHDYRYRLVDVFTEVPFQGNQLAVFPQALGLTDVLMQQIARELNLAETTFVLPASLPGCVADVRIFTPFKEMRFAGHPTIGTAHVLMQEKQVESTATEFTLQEKIGRVAVRVAREAGNPIWLRTPWIDWGKTYERVPCAAALGLEPDDLLECLPQRLSAGNPTLLIPLQSPEVVDRAWLGADGMRSLRGSDPESFCVFVFARTPTGAYSRMFAPEFGVPEDPATGSSTGPLAAYMMKHGLTSRADGARFISEQGAKMGRRSLLHVHIRGDSGSIGIDVGGHVVAVGDGTIRVRLPGEPRKEEAHPLGDPDTRKS
jgi:trans-2,3-dihydro-3-hydroxyanthranilate isomerase